MFNHPPYNLSRVNDLSDLNDLSTSRSRTSELKQARRIQLQSLKLAFAEEKVSAGFPSPAQDYAERDFDLNRYLVSNVNATFLVRVASWSMRDAGIDLDDTLLVDRSLTAKHNDIVIAMIDNEFTLKRLMCDQEQFWLKAENPDYQDIHLSELQEAMIWGVVTFIIKKVRQP